MNFKLIDTKSPIEGILLIEPTVYGDDRGFFMETFSEKAFHEMGIMEKFVQENHSRSKRGVLRGMHLQRWNSQGKLIRVMRGSVYDVAVDLRPDSPTYGQWFAAEISAKNHLMMYIPPQFAHGFLALEDDTDFSYKCTDYYTPQAESGVVWNDQNIAIDWQLEHYGIKKEELIIAPRDSQFPTLKNIDKEKLWVY